MLDTRYRVEIPGGIHLESQVVGPVARGLAVAIDAVISSILIFVLMLAAIPLNLGGMGGGFFLILLFARVDITWTESLVLIPMIYLTTTALPTLGFAEVMTRGTVTLFFLSMASDNSLGILTASFLLWVVNIALPALLGGLSIFGVRIFRNRR